MPLRRDFLFTYAHHRAALRSLAWSFDLSFTCDSIHVRKNLRRCENTAESRITLNTQSKYNIETTKKLFYFFYRIFKESM